MKTVKQNIKMLCILIPIILFTGCGLSSYNYPRRYIIKKQMKDYAGDGTMKYYSGAFLGSPGVEITFEELSLTQKFSRTYKLVNLPVTKRSYAACFYVEPSPPIEYINDERRLNTKAILRMKLLFNSASNSTVLFDFKEPLSSELWSWENGYSAYYFNQFAQPPNAISDFEVKINNNSYLLYVEYDPNGTPIGTSGCFRVSSGGYK